MAPLPKAPKPASRPCVQTSTALVLEALSIHATSGAEDVHTSAWSLHRRPKFVGGMRFFDCQRPKHTLPDWRRRQERESKALRTTPSVKAPYVYTCVVGPRPPHGNSRKLVLLRHSFECFSTSGQSCQHFRHCRDNDAFALIVVMSPEGGRAARAKALHLSSEALLPEMSYLSSASFASSIERCAATLRAATFSPTT